MKAENKFKVGDYVRYDVEQYKAKTGIAPILYVQNGQFPEWSGLECPIDYYSQCSSSCRCINQSDIFKIVWCNGIMFCILSEDKMLRYCSWLYLLPVSNLELLSRSPDFDMWENKIENRSSTGQELNQV